MNPGAPLLPTAEGTSSKKVEYGEHLAQGPALLGQDNSCDGKQDYTQALIS